MHFLKQERMGYRLLAYKKSYHPNQNTLWLGGPSLSSLPAHHCPLGCRRLDKHWAPRQSHPVIINPHRRGGPASSGSAKPTGQRWAAEPKGILILMIRFFISKPTIWYICGTVPHMYHIIIVCMVNLIVYWRVETTRNELSQIIYY